MSLSLWLRVSLGVYCYSCPWCNTATVNLKCESGVGLGVPTALVDPLFLCNDAQLSFTFFLKTHNEDENVD